MPVNDTGDWIGYGFVLLVMLAFFAFAAIGVVSLILVLGGWL